MSSPRKEKSIYWPHKKSSGVKGVAAVALCLIFWLGHSALASSKINTIQLPGSPLAGKTWVRTGGPMGGRGYDIRMRPDNPDIMYVTDQFAGIHKSVDGGRTWFPINEGIDARAGTTGDAIPTFCLTIDPNDYDIIWAGTLGFRGIYRSADGGRTWEKRTNGIVEGFDLTLRGFAIEPGNSNVVYAAGDHDAGRPGFTFQVVKGVVYKTIDGGLNWEAIWRGDNLARYVLIDPTDVKTIYLSTGLWDREAANSDWNAGILGGVGILKTTDGGITWRTINVGLNNLYISSLFMHPQNPRILLAGAGCGAPSHLVVGSGVYLTSDGGEHWTQVVESGGPVTSVEFAQDTSIAYAHGGSFYRSEDGGRTWIIEWGQTGFWGPPGIRLGPTVDFQVDPRYPMRFFANGYNGGNILSEDGGHTCVNSSNGYVGSEVNGITTDPKNASIVFACEKGGPHASSDGGQTWRGINTVLNLYPLPGCQKIVVDPTDSSHLLMSENKDARAYESHDGGTTWYNTVDYREELWSKHISTAAETFLAMAFAPSQPRRVYGGFGTSVGGSLDITTMTKTPIMSFLISEDGGHTWIRRDGTGLDGWSVTDIVVHPTNADIAWASTAGAGVFLTLDGGTTWQSLSTGLNTLVIAGLALNPQNTNELYAATPNRGVFKTDNGCLTWRNAGTGMNPNETIAGVVIDPKRPNVVYAASLASGVFVSEDAGESWRLINTGLRTKAARSLSISSDGLILYVGTVGEGVFRLGDLAAPEITGVSPVVGPSTGGTAATIQGSGFIAGETSVTFGGMAGTSVNVISSAVLSVVTPPHAAGAVPVTVTTTYGTGSLAAGFTYELVPPVINVSAPNGGESWAAGIIRNITWTSTAVANVKIEYSTNGGTDWTTTIASTPNTGSYGWTVPNTPSTNCLARVSEAATGNPSDVSNAFFTILGLPTISGAVKTAGGVAIEGVTMTFSDGGGTATTDVSGNYAKAMNYGWTGTATPSKAGYTFAPSSRSYTNVTANQADQSFTATLVVPPKIGLSRSSFTFGGSQAGQKSSTQQLIISNTGGGTLTWSISVIAPVQGANWLACDPTSGTGGVSINLLANPSGLSSGTYSATLSITAAGAVNSPQMVSINLQVYEGTNPPLGVVDTPADGTTGIEGSVPVTGWAVDDIEVVSVKIYRDPGEGEQAGPNGYVYIGDAVFVEGARPDVEQAYPNYPLTYKAGWGYMLLTNFLPNGGNGTFRLTAIATDNEGKTTTLGSKTITCDNAHAVLPFGAIDVPSQGGLASGSSFINYAWVLATGRKCIPSDGSTITAWVDGLPIGHPSYGYYRVDIATLFPGYCNANGAIGFIPIDTTKYANGVHTIVWSATDSAGVNNGFGSRYFTIQNGGGGASLGAQNLSAGRPVSMEPGKDTGTIRQLEDIPRDALSPLRVRRGFDLNQPVETVFPGKDGTVEVEIRELERVVIYLDVEGVSISAEKELPLSSRFDKWERYLAYLVVGDELRPLPVGSTFDAERGTLVWQTGPGFLGDYQFILKDLTAGSKRNLKIRIRPK